MNQNKMGRTIRGDRLHIGFFGKRNAGKSSLINALTGQKVSIISDTPGTTTDPVYKSMELSPIGPVVLIDTAGIDDTDSKLGKLRSGRTEKILKKTQLAILVIDTKTRDFDFENNLIETFLTNNISFFIVLNKIDLENDQETIQWLKGKKYIPVSARTREGLDLLKGEIQEKAPRQWEPPFLMDLIHPGDIVLLVTPIDLGAPKGRIIMPQVKALRDILDADAIPVMCKERELLSVLRKLNGPPALVITDSQVFPQVAADIPNDIPLTSFSILSARQKGDLGQLVNGVLAVNNLKPGDKVLIAETCTHHPMEDDIGRIKIPRWLNHYVGGNLKIKTVPGSNYPANLDDYKLVVHCGGCTINRKEMLNRQKQAIDKSVPITNYGVLIAFLKSVFPRALEPFPELKSLFGTAGELCSRDIRKKMALFAEI